MQRVGVKRRSGERGLGMEYMPGKVRIAGGVSGVEGGVRVILVVGGDGGGGGGRTIG